MKKKALKNLELSHATLKTEDLIQSFMQFVKSYNKQDYYMLCDMLIDSISNPDEFLNEILFDYLNGIAPDNYYFGSLPGDGACFGFWKNEEEI